MVDITKYIFSTKILVKQFVFLYLPTSEDVKYYNCKFIRCLKLTFKRIVANSKKLNNLEKIENIIFDLGGVIIDIDLQKTIKKLEGLNKSGRRLFPRMKNAEFLYQFEKGEISNQDFLQNINDLLEIEQNHSLIREAWNSMLLGIPQKRIEKLYQLRESFRIFLLSNINSIHFLKLKDILDQTMGFNDFERIFDSTFYSHLIGKRKPDLECYHYVINEKNLIPDKTLFVDDSLENVEGALKAGLKSVHLLSGADFPELFKNGRITN